MRYSKTGKSRIQIALRISEVNIKDLFFGLLLFNENIFSSFERNIPAPLNLGTYKVKNKHVFFKDNE